MILFEKKRGDNQIPCQLITLAIETAIITFCSETDYNGSGGRKSETVRANFGLQRQRNRNASFDLNSPTYWSEPKSSCSSAWIDRKWCSSWITCGWWVFVVWIVSYRKKSYTLLYLFDIVIEELRKWGRIQRDSFKNVFVVNLSDRYMYIFVKGWLWKVVIIIASHSPYRLKIKKSLKLPQQLSKPILYPHW